MMIPMPEDIKARLLEVCIGQKTDLIAIGEQTTNLVIYLRCGSQLLDKSDTPASSVTAIGNHGQTVFHQPTGDSPFTMQLGERQYHCR